MRFKTEDWWRKQAKREVLHQSPKELRLAIRAGKKGNDIAKISRKLY